MKKHGIHSNWKAYLSTEKKRFSAIKKYSPLFFIIPAVGISCLYLFLKAFILPHVSLDLRLPDFNNKFQVIVLIIDFVILNPIIEEFFWRKFCHKFISDKHWKGILNVALHYGFYHFFVINFITSSILLGIVAFCSITVLGVIFTFINKHFGIWCAVIAHMAVDLFAGLVLWDLHSNFIKLFWY